jgi:hypothetical protein
MQTMNSYDVCYARLAVIYLDFRLHHTKQATDYTVTRLLEANTCLCVVNLRFIWHQKYHHHAVSLAHGRLAVRPDDPLNVLG